MGRPYVKWFVQFFLASVLMILVAVFLTGSGTMDEMFIRFMLRGAVAGCIGIVLGDVSLYRGSRFILTAVLVTLFFCGVAILAVEMVTGELVTHEIAESLENTLHEQITCPVNVTVHIEPDIPALRK